jgi:phospholipid/cholesterol/gamma-HCH transport system substrate-binding protein
MTRGRAPIIKFAIFAVVMAMLTTLLFVIFGQYRNESTTSYSAVFSDVSRLTTGDSVRAAGIRVGTVREIDPQTDDNVLVTFDADSNVRLTSGTKAMVRYLNLAGDRYLDLVDSPGSTRILAPGAQIPLERTAPALDLDLLLGGLKPVIRGLNPQDVNALSSSLLQVFQGQGANLQSLLAKTSSFTSSIADNGDVVQQVITNLNAVAVILAKDGGQLGGTLDRLQRLVAELSDNRDTIGSAITSLSAGTTSVADLLTQSRPPLNGTVDQLNRLSANIAGDLPTLDEALQTAPGNYRKLVRLGSYGSWFNYYLCGLTVRVTDLQGRTAVFPWIKQETGRCADR